MFWQFLYEKSAPSAKFKGRTTDSGGGGGGGGGLNSKWQIYMLVI